MMRALLMLIAALTITGSAPAGTGARADWGRLDSLDTGDAIAGPAGWLNWCMADRARCAPAGRPRPVRVTAALLALLESVQARVNGALTPRAEPPGQDLWQLGAASGDCEDYALAKQAALRAAGLPAGAARLATTRLPHGELHYPPERRLGQAGDPRPRHRHAGQAGPRSVRGPARHDMWIVREAAREPSGMG